jgi:hypothetical protein
MDGTPMRTGVFFGIDKIPPEALVIIDAIEKAAAQAALDQARVDMIQRAVARGMAPLLSRLLTEWYELRRSKARGMPCAHIIKTGRCQGQNFDSYCPCVIPMHDHFEVFNSPAGRVVIAHEYGYGSTSGKIGELVDYCRTWDLDFSITASSPYFYGACVQVMVMGNDFWSRLDEYRNGRRDATEPA